jgi:hypothetical protein
MAGQILTQKKRIDTMVRSESERRKKVGSENYADKRIRAEMDTMAAMVKTLHSMMKNPLEAADEALRATNSLANALKLNISDAAEKSLTEMILTGNIKVGGEDDITRH